MAGEDFFKFNKGNEFRFSNFREIKEEDLKGADEKTKKLFNIFAGEDKILQEVEAKSLFNVLKSAAGNNQVLEDNEIKAFAKEHIGEEVDTNILATFVNNIFGAKEKPQNQAVQVANGYAAQKQQTFLEEAACKEVTCQIIDKNIKEASVIFNSQHLGTISEAYDNAKDENDKLKSSNVAKVLQYQEAGLTQIIEAKNKNLTRRQYYKENIQRIKDMILIRLNVLKTPTGRSFLDIYKDNYSKKEIEQIIDHFININFSNRPIEALKNFQTKFVALDLEEEIDLLYSIVNSAKTSAATPRLTGEKVVELPSWGDIKIPKDYDGDELITFEEVYKIERGTEYSQYKIEQYALAKKEMEVVANAYNKKQQFIEFAEGLRKDETLNIDEKTQKVLEGFATFYALAEDGGLSQLKELIAESNLPISIDENGFNFGSLDDNAKNRALNSLLKLAQQEKETEFEEFLNGKTVEEYQEALAKAHDEAIGDENGKMMAEAMKNDNLTCIQRWTGNTSMLGMGMTVVGGILCFTPLALLGAGMVTAGNTLAIGGMVAKTGLGVADYATKDVQTAEEAEQLTKDFIIDAGGFIIGMKAGQAGLKAFSKLIDQKLVAVFGQQIASGNKMQALKTVFTNPEYLKNFMTAAGAKLSADFVISYAGDLAMMGILDTQDDWQSLLKANLTGILVGMSGDIKDVSGVGRPRNFGVSDDVKGVNEASRFDQPTSPHVKKPMTEMDYGQRLLGNDVAEVKGEANDASFLETNDALPNKRTPKTTTFTPPKRQDLVDEAVKVNDITRPDLVQFAKEMQDLGFPDIAIAKFINWHKTQAGSINRNLLPVLEKLHKLKLVSKDLIEVVMNPDGSINQKNFDAIDFFNTKFNALGSKDNMTSEGIAAWIKVAKDSEGNFSEARFNELSKMLDDTIDLNKNIPSTSKQNHTTSKNKTLTTNNKGLFLKACLDEAGNIHPQKLEFVQNLLNTGMKPLDLLKLINLAQKHNKTISDYYDVAYSVVLKDSFRTNKNVYIMSEIESLLNANGTVSREALNAYNLIGPTEALANLTTGIFKVAKDAKGNFSRENYDFLLNALAKCPEYNRQNLNTIENIAKLSRDANGKIIEQDFNTVKALADLNVTVDAAKLIMSNCKRNGNFNSNLFDKFINVIKQQQPADISEVKSTNIFIEKGKVYFVTVLNNGKSKKKAVSCNDINIELISGLTTSRDKNGSKIFVEKATDVSGVSQKIISTPNVSLKEQTKIIRDANGKPIRYEHYTESDIPGIYDIRVRDANTGETKILSTAKIDKETGNVSVIKDFESSDGTRTQYQYLDDPQGNRSFEYRIFDKDGNVLMDDRQTFTVLTENKFISTYNDRLYNIEFTEHTLTVTCKNSGEKVVFILNNFIESANKQPLLDLLKQLPGQELIELHKSTNKLTFLNDKLQSSFDHSNKELEVGSDVSVLLHEAGHGKHTFKAGSQLFEVNPDIQKAYLEELDSFKKIATDREQDFIAYFIDPRQHTRKLWKDVGMIFETIAETNSLLGTYYHSPELAIRAQYLQQHFPKTIAAISNAMKSSEFLVKSFDNEPLVTKTIQAGNKEKIIVDPNTEKIMYRTAEFLHQKGLTIQEAVANAMRKYGFGSDATQDLTYRTKGVQSLYDKLRNYAIDNSDKTKTHADAVNSVKDLIGTRTVAKTADYTSHPDVKKLIEAGYTEAAVLRAAELQAEPTLQKLKNLIEKNANGNGDLTIARISNYMGKDGIPYFSQRQLADLKWYAERRGVKLDFVVRAPESDPKFDQMNISLADSKNPTKIRESGYTALQINFKTPSGQVFEWQFRGDKVNVFAEAEHVPYDLRTNKDIISGNPELAPLYEPIKTLLSKDTMSEPVYNRYNEYLTDFYKHLRKLELGFQSNAPKVEDYGNYDSRLSAENLIILHDVAEKIKKAVKVEGKNSPKIQEYLNEYNALVNS